jgi:hypothetical protein
MVVICHSSSLRCEQRSLQSVGKYAKALVEVSYKYQVGTKGHHQSICITALRSGVIALFNVVIINMKLMIGVLLNANLDK